MIRVICALLGVALLVLLWLSVLRTVFVPRRTSSRVARTTVWLVTTASGALARVLPRKSSERVMDLCAPVAMLLIGTWWLAVQALAFVLLAIGIADVPFRAHSMVAFVELRLPDASGALAIVGYISTMLLVGAFVTHLIRFTDAYSRRERLVTQLAGTASRPADADQVVADYLRVGSRERLDAFFAEWTTWLGDVEATHLGYPALPYYRSVDELSWLGAAVIVLDAAALTNAMAPEWAPPHATTLINSGSACFGRMAERIGIAVPVATVSLQGREECGFDDTVRLAIEAGLPRQRDRRTAWLAFQGMRTGYAPHVAMICEHLLYDRLDEAAVSEIRDPSEVIG